MNPDENTKIPQNTEIRTQRTAEGPVEGNQTSRFQLIHLDEDNL